MTVRITLGELFEAINDTAANHDEAVATFAYLVNSGAVRLGGLLAGAIVDLDDGRDLAA